MINLLSRRRPPVFRCSASVGGGCLPCFLRSSLFSFVSPPSLPLLLVDMQFVVDFSPVSLSGGYKSGAVICQIFVVAGPSGLSGGALSLVWFFWRPLAWLMTRTCVLSKGVSVLGSLRRPFFSHHQCEIVVVGVDFGSLTSDSVVVVSCYRRFFGVGGCGLFLWLEGDYVRPMSMSEILFLVGVGCGALMKRIGWIFPVWCISPVLGGCPCVGPRCCRPGLTLSVAAFRWLWRVYHPFTSPNKSGSLAYCFGVGEVLVRSVTTQTAQ
ncbi:LOW QUALITY PROTEIN: hypothetical protein HID58_086205 [Brassica napus]|uniref:Transmembrane protein n=1 Tax=Brassica napus TaxID=3708 RepID=A0ABQ7XPN5_BRANA|nr:LOW QUALITY PROTEIN: hypothetical protein HID58_086205 [Brassica napus]